MPELKVEEIIEEAQRRIGEKSERNQIYTKVESCYYKGLTTGELDALIGVNSARSKTEKRLLNTTARKVLHVGNLFTVMPDMHFNAIQSEEESADWWAHWSLLRMKEWWKKVRMFQILQTWGHYSALLGTTPVVMIPDFDKKTIIPEVRHPGTCYPLPSFGSNFTYDDVMFISEIEGKRLLNRYPSITKNTDRIANSMKESYLFIEYIDKGNRQFYVTNKQRGSSGQFQSGIKVKVPEVGIEHNLGFVPVRINQNYLNPNDTDGVPPLYNQLRMEENIAELILMLTRAVRNAVFATTVIEKGQNLPKDLPQPGTGGAIQVQEGGDMRFVSPPITFAQVLPSVIGFLEQLMRQDINYAGANTGSIPASIWTKPAIQMAQGSFHDEAQAMKNSIAFDLQLLNEMYFKMMKHYFADDAMESFFSPEKWYPADLPDEFFHEIIFTPLGSDIQSLIVNLIQLASAGFFSAASVLERIPGVDAWEEIRRLYIEQKQKMQQQFELEAFKAQLAGQPATGTGLNPKAPLEGMTPEDMQSALYAIQQGGRMGNAPSLPAPQMAGGMTGQMGGLQ